MPTSIATNHRKRTGKKWVGNRNSPPFRERGLGLGKKRCEEEVSSRGWLWSDVNRQMARCLPIECLECEARYIKMENLILGLGACELIDLQLIDVNRKVQS